MTPEVLPKSLETTRRDVVNSTAPVLGRIKLLRVTDAASYSIADTLLSKIREARKLVKGKIDAVLKPLNEARGAILSLSHELDDPLEAGEQKVRAAMQEFKREEMRQAREEEERRAAEEEKLRREAADKHMKELAAKTEPMRKRLAEQRSLLEEQADAVVTAPAPAPVRAANSTTRTVKKWRVTNGDALLQAAADLDSDVPQNIFILDTQEMNDWLKKYPEVVAKWPGVEVYDDVQIVGGRRG